MIQFPTIPSWDALHPLVIHFPIALLLVVPFLIVVGALRSARKRSNDTLRRVGTDDRGHTGDLPGSRKRRGGRANGGTNSPESTQSWNTMSNWPRRRASPSQS